MSRHTPRSILIVITVLALAVWAIAVGLPHTFEAGSIINASEVNENFAALQEAKQHRVSDECQVGTAIRAINEDGSVECEAASAGPQAFHAETGSGPSDITQSPTFRQVLTLALPAGSYVVNARLSIINRDATEDATVRCNLDGRPTDTYAVSLAAGQSLALPLQSVVTTATGTTVRLRCRKGGNDTAQVSVTERPRITAVSVASVERP